jgi:hypothetical protein
MANIGPVIHTSLGVLRVDDRDVRITLASAADGIEIVGRLFFAEPEWTNNGIPDRGIVPGRTHEEVLERAQQLTTDELLLRYRRANAEKRRFHGLRHLVGDFLNKVRYINQVGVSMRSGLLDAEGANQELVMTEEQMIALVRQMKNVAGVES